MCRDSIGPLACPLRATEAERAYWTVIAQVLPVVGLALVLEARTLAHAFETGAGSAAVDWNQRSFAARPTLDPGGRRTRNRLRPDHQPDRLSPRRSTHRESGDRDWAIPCSVGALVINPIVNVVVASRIQGEGPDVESRSRLFGRRVATDTNTS